MITYFPILLYTGIVCLACAGIHISMSWRREPFYKLLIGLLVIIIFHTLTAYLVGFVFPKYSYLEMGLLWGWLYSPMAYYMIKIGTGHPFTKKDTLHLFPFIVVLSFFVTATFIQQIGVDDIRIYGSILRGGLGLTCLGYLIWAINYHVKHKVSTAFGEDRGEAKEENEDIAKKTKIEYKRYIKHVDKFIAAKHYLDPSMNLDKFASLVDIPKTHIPLLFQEHYKVTFSHFVNTLRIKYACSKLKEPLFSLSVDELADECGFRSRASFYRNFNQEMACTPLEYRKKVITDML